MKHPFSRMSDEQRLETFRKLIAWSKHAVFLGGAGVSTESGIPDFRSRDGLYHRTEKRFARYQPEYLLSCECLSHEPDVFFDYYRTHLDARSVEPNAAHRILAQWEREGRLAGIITQNIDGLHQKAGSVNVQEIHGTTWSNHCVRCGAAYGVDFIFESTGKPRCPKCGGMVRPDVTLYGEFLPREAHDNARRLIRDADLLIIGGTSLQVGSAAGLARQFSAASPSGFSGGRMVIINRSRTLLDGEADLVFHDSIGRVLTEVNAGI